MIREVEGDILLSSAQVIAHGIATHDPFDSGLALALRERLSMAIYFDPLLANKIDPPLHV